LTIERGMRHALGSWIRKRPHTTSAVVFGTLTAALVHFAWVPDGRFTGDVPLLTVMSGLAHAIAGATAAPRLMDPRRTATTFQACAVGACTSLGALALFSPILAFWIQATSTRADVMSFITLIPFVGFFSFLAAGWALLLLCVAIAWAIFQLAR
jgi:hypothetical protein